MWSHAIANCYKGCDNQYENRWSQNSSSGNVHYKDSLTSEYEELQAELKELQAQKHPDMKKIQEVQNKIQQNEKASAEKKRRATYLELKIIYDNGKVAEGWPERYIGDNKNYLRGDRDLKPSEIKIQLSDVVSIVKEK